MNAAGQRSDLPVRVASGVVAAAVALTCLWLGGLAFWALVALLAAAMIGEWCGLIRAPAWKMLVAIGMIAMLMVLLLAGLEGHPLVIGPRESNYAVAVTADGYSGAVVAAAILALGGALVTLSAPLGFGLLYVGLPAVSLLFLRSGGGGFSGDAFGFGVTLLVLLIIWSTDIGAYFAGRAIGGPKLAPRISPNKTWAGLVGGAVAAVVVSEALLETVVLREHRLPTAGVPFRTYFLYGLFAAAAAVLAQGGDLFESWLKRRVGAKDSGRLLPGHGGALDRLDGLVPVAVAAALLMFFAR